MPGRPEKIGGGGEDPVELCFFRLGFDMGRGVSLKMVRARFPNNHGVFLAKTDHFEGVTWGYRHLRKDPYYGG